MYKVHEVVTIKHKNCVYLSKFVVLFLNRTRYRFANLAYETEFKTTSWGKIRKTPTHIATRKSFKLMEAEAEAEFSHLNLKMTENHFLQFTSRRRSVLKLKIHYEIVYLCRRKNLSNKSKINNLMKTSVKKLRLMVSRTISGRLVQRKIFVFRKQIIVFPVIFCYFYKYDTRGLGLGAKRFTTVLI